MTLLEWDRRVAAVAQCHVDDPAVPVLASTDEHHLRTVLRARPGEEIVVTDGAGAWALAAVEEGGLTALTPVHRDPRPPETVLYLTPLKGDRDEWAVAKATELGLSRIVPLVSQRVVVKFRGDVRERVLARWRRIARESAGQCRRTHDLVIDAPVTPSEVPEGVAICDFVGTADWSGVRAVAVGPEGGWAPGEWDAARRRLTLGPTVLRAETANVVAASLLAFGAGGWGFTLRGDGMGNDEDYD